VPTELRGWLLDVYPGLQDGVLLWLLGEDGRRHCLRQPFPVAFYAAGPPSRLHALCLYLAAYPAPVTFLRAGRRELFTHQILTVLAVQVDSFEVQSRLFNQVSQAFPDLTYFDADISLPLRHAARYGTFPQARCAVVVDQEQNILELQVLDTPWDLDPPAPPLRILRMEPDADPARRPPRHLLVHLEQDPSTIRLALQPERPLLINLRALLHRLDPDLLLTAAGDTWMLPHLLERAQALRLPLPLNRDPARQPAYHPEKSYFSYGQVIYRGRQVHLFGRWHIDRGNAMLWDDYDLLGVLETARVTGLPVQTAARASPGTGISAMQVLTALRNQILVPWHKQQPESPKTALQMFAADQGGLVYQPQVGLHHDVGEVDFTSMYPGIMVRFNISPETVTASREPVPAKPGGQGSESGPVGSTITGSSGRPPAEELARFHPDFPGIDDSGDDQLGLIPKTLSPLLEKRLALKTKLAQLLADPKSRWDPRRPIYQARASAHKWLLVTCFGYLGYKNARFGRIEAHEAVTAYGREALLRAKEAAEDLGFTVLHLYVDGLWVKKPGATSVADFQPLLDAVSERTGLPIALDGVYRWVAFVPSRVDMRWPVPNRYFGVFQDGSLKVRGVEARRHDTPAFIAKVQMQMLELLAEEVTRLPPPYDLRPVLALLRRKLADLRLGRVPLEGLIVSQKLSRELEEYRQPSPAARAAAQLQVLGRSFRPGQRVRFLYTRGEPGVSAWDLPRSPDPSSLDVARYTRLLLRAAHAVLGPFGLSEEDLRQQVADIPASQLALPQESLVDRLSKFRDHLKNQARSSNAAGSPH
jgi:DNA polymerase-2